MLKVSIGRYLFALLINLCCNVIAQELASCPTILDYIQKNLPHYGVLRNSHGFVYVDIDDEYIHELVAFIQKDGFEEPSYFGNSDLVGARITVIYPDEIKKYNIEFQECEETIDFVPKHCQVVRPPKQQRLDEVYIVVVDAPELDRIREKYGLPKREYDFHITIGVKPKAAFPAVSLAWFNFAQHGCNFTALVNAPNIIRR